MADLAAAQDIAVSTLRRYLADARAGSSRASKTTRLQPPQPDSYEAAPGGGVRAFWWSDRPDVIDYLKG